MKAYGMRRSDVVKWKCCPGHDNRERKYLLRTLWHGQGGKLNNGTNAKNRDRARKKHARQEARHFIKTEIS